jgi:hypothetical protein
VALSPPPRVNHIMTSGRHGQWDRNFAKTHGHLRLPSTPHSETRRLGKWLWAQKSLRKAIPDHQRQKLEILSKYKGPTKEEKQWAAWDDMYKKMLSFYGVNSHFSVTKSEDLKLHNWIAKQRKLRDNLQDERREKLEEVNFEFQCVEYVKKKSFSSHQEAKWEAMYKQLVEFHKTTGNCAVPFSWAANPPFGTWVSRQRNDFTRHVMDPARRKRLVELDFA